MIKITKKEDLPEEIKRKNKKLYNLIEESPDISHEESQKRFEEIARDYAIWRYHYLNELKKNLS